METMERKLSTILAADVVGFSKMMAADEEGTLEILKNRRFVIDTSIKEQGEVERPVDPERASTLVQGIRRWEKNHGGRR